MRRQVLRKERSNTTQGDKRSKRKVHTSPQGTRLNYHRVCRRVDGLPGWQRELSTLRYPSDLFRIFARAMKLASFLGNLARDGVIRVAVARGDRNLFQGLSGARQGYPNRDCTRVMSLVAGSIRRKGVLLRVNFVRRVARSRRCTRACLVLAQYFRPFFRMFPGPHLIATSGDFSSSGLGHVTRQPTISGPRGAYRAIGVSFRVLIKTSTSRRRTLRRTFFRVGPINYIGMTLPIYLNGPYDRFPRHQRAGTRRVFRPQIGSLNGLTIPVFHRCRRVFFSNRAIRSGLFRALLCDGVWGIRRE